MFASETFIDFLAYDAVGDVLSLYSTPVYLLLLWQRSLCVNNSMGWVAAGDCLNVGYVQVSNGLPDGVGVVRDCKHDR